MAPENRSHLSSDVDAIRELLLYGLKETDCDIISSDSDDLARFIAEKVRTRTSCPCF